ncbi:DciA family protein [Actinobacillus equuli subsp. haemolyticus]|uniref:DciA family protein n=1 Tax=Actinobacillus equuli TaxID=718 RepID=UPI0024436B6E|nr:DciA family protein [Actinobacillus equuli]WGE64246.1 DciA family protein [Actinobacillus equuli subsp. haemolyticus]WGE67918.1 DciA family protein [Actinobacillus equuli subsp. haemolyticus]WGE70375.1 DciA family protein [Actinobacillus equuli subsp. haemolyticus]
MKNSAIKNITEVLQNSSLSRIVQRANQLNDLHQKVQKLLPEQYRGLYRIVNLVDNQLVFEVQNATVRQGLQLQSSHLLRLIHSDFPNVTELQFKVNPSFKHI